MLKIQVTAAYTSRLLAGEHVVEVDILEHAQTLEIVNRAGDRHVTLFLQPVDLIVLSCPQAPSVNMAVANEAPSTASPYVQLCTSSKF